MDVINDGNSRSYMSSHVLLNLLNKLGNSDIKRDLQSLVKFNNTGAQMLDSIYQMALKFRIITVLA